MLEKTDIVINNIYTTILTCPGITTAAFKCGAFNRKSLIKASVKPFTANLLAAYDVCGVRNPTEAQNPLTDEVFTTYPYLHAFNIGINARTE